MAKDSKEIKDSEVNKLEKDVNEQLKNISKLPIDEQIQMLNSILSLLQTELNGD